MNFQVCDRAMVPIDKKIIVNVAVVTETLKLTKILKINKQINPKNLQINKINGFENILMFDLQHGHGGRISK